MRDTPLCATGSSSPVDSVSDGVSLAVADKSPDKSTPPRELAFAAVGVCDGDGIAHQLQPSLSYTPKRCAEQNTV